VECEAATGLILLGRRLCVRGDRLWKYGCQLGVIRRQLKGKGKMRGSLHFALGASVEMTAVGVSWADGEGES
jgi:hypothetical protein